MPGPEQLHGHRSGFVSLIGRSNVGKSTLINTLLAHKVASVSPKPQTTHRKQLAILTLPQAQVIFIDTPGIHRPHHKLGEAMNRAAERALQDSDLLLVIFDISRDPTPADRLVAEKILSLNASPEMLIALNKMDAITGPEIDHRRARFGSLLPGVEMMILSALRAESARGLLDRLIELLPEGPRYYPESEITLATERDIAADLIRAACLQLLRDEIPYCIAVRIDEYQERDQHGAYIRATLLVERESQKGIVIGRRGRMLREIGSLARKDIETMSGRRVYLDIRVKVLPRWRNDPGALSRLGYPAPKG